MNRTIALALAALIMLSSPTAVLAADTEMTRGEAVREVVNFLYLADEGFELENYYCMHERGYVHFVPDDVLMVSGYPLLCEVYASVLPPEFTDVSAEDGSLSVQIVLAKEMGIIDGYDDGSFRPDKPVTYNEAVKMLLCAFGFGRLRSSGTYPDDYTKTAEDIGLTAGLSFNGGDVVTENAFGVMISNALNNSYGGVNLSRIKFTPSKTGLECAEAFAGAIENRNGMSLFALYSDELKEEMRGELEGMGWVTGVSSPWVTDYDISQRDGLHFDVTFRLATSDGSAGSEAYTLIVREINGIYYITGLEQRGYDEQQG